MRCWHFQATPGHAYWHIITLYGGRPATLFRVWAYIQTMLIDIFIYLLAKVMQGGGWSRPALPCYAFNITSGAILLTFDIFEMIIELSYWHFDISYMPDCSHCGYNTQCWYLFTLFRALASRTAAHVTAANSSFSALLSFIYDYAIIRAVQETHSQRIHIDMQLEAW